MIPTWLQILRVSIYLSVFMGESFFELDVFFHKLYRRRGIYGISLIDFEEICKKSMFCLEFGLSLVLI